MVTPQIGALHKHLVYPFYSHIGSSLLRICVVKSQASQHIQHCTQFCNLFSQSQTCLSRILNTFGRL